MGTKGAKIKRRRIFPCIQNNSFYHCAKIKSFSREEITYPFLVFRGLALRNLVSAIRSSSTAHLLTIPRPLGCCSPYSDFLRGFQPLGPGKSLSDSSSCKTSVCAFPLGLLRLGHFA